MIVQRKKYIAFILRKKGGYVMTNNLYASKEVVNQVNRAVICLWHQQIPRPPLLRQQLLWPLLYLKPKKAAILFVGLNPSFSASGMAQATGKAFTASYIQSLYDFSSSPSNICTMLKMDVKCKKNYPYFNKFKKIASSCNMDWEHIDLFFYRETQQKSFKPKILDKEPTTLNRFGSEQIKLSKRLIINANPKVIVVANAFASDLFKKEFEFDLTWDNGHGYYIMKINDRIIPVFLTSMLTGQRALDLHSLKSLTWSIEQSIKRFY